MRLANKRRSASQWQSEPQSLISSEDGCNDADESMTVGLWQAVFKWHQQVVSWHRRCAWSANREFHISYTLRGSLLGRGFELCRNPQISWRREWDSNRRSRENLAPQGKALGANDYGPPFVSLEFSPDCVFLGGALADILPIWVERPRGGSLPNWKHRSYLDVTRRLSGSSPRPQRMPMARLFATDQR